MISQLLKVEDLSYGLQVNTHRSPAYLLACTASFMSHARAVYNMSRTIIFWWRWASRSPCTRLVSVERGICRDLRHARFRDVVSSAISWQGEHIFGTCRAQLGSRKCRARPLHSGQFSCTQWY